jgi:hypothetical protein
VVEPIAAKALAGASQTMTRQEAVTMTEGRTSEGSPSAARAANLSEANLSGADPRSVSLIKANLSGADLGECCSVNTSQFFSTSRNPGAATRTRRSPCSLAWHGSSLPISDAKNVLQELRAIVPDLPSVPVQPIILAVQEEPGMFDFYRNFRSFLNVHRYASQEQLIADLGEKVIRPAELKVLDLQGST